MRLLAACTLALALALPVWALSEADKPLALAVIQYGHDHLDPATGLIKDTTDIPSIAESSIGYVAACFLLGQDLDQARSVLGHILDLQLAKGTQAGHFPWQGDAGAKLSEEAVLYMAPLLSAIYRHGAANLGEALQQRLRQSLELACGAVSRTKAAPADDSRFLLRAAALGTLGAVGGGETVYHNGTVARDFTLQLFGYFSSGKRRSINS
jgi:hypothetical protein